jgi:hypothetical protein
VQGDEDPALLRQVVRGWRDRRAFDAAGHLRVKRVLT